MTAVAGPLERSLALEPLAPGRFRAVFGPDWWGMRGPHGGWMAALFVRAMEAIVADPARVPRSLNIHFVSGSSPGPVELEVREERRGGRLSTLSARLEQEGNLVALALAAFSAGRSGTPEYSDLARPPAPPPSEVPALNRDFAAGFVGRFDYRPVGGRAVFRGGESARTGGWMRVREEPAVGAAALALFADAWMPAAFFRVSTPVFAPTVDLTIHFRADPRQVDFGPEGWVYAEFSSLHSEQGFWEEDGVIFAPDGRLLAQSRQLALMLERPAVT